MTMTENELLAAATEILACSVQVGEGMTMEEFAEGLGLSNHTARKTLKRLSREGRIMPVRVLRQNIAGFEQHVTGYRLKA